jgi:hypothetical protein
VCTTQASLFLGQWPASPADTMFVPGTPCLLFPERLDTSFLYPVTSTVYTFDDGTQASVPCFIPKVEWSVPEVECPDPFVNALADDSVESCVQSCPVAAYTDEVCDRIHLWP